MIKIRKIIDKFKNKTKNTQGELLVFGCNNNIYIINMPPYISYKIKQRNNDFAKIIIRTKYSTTMYYLSYVTVNGKTDYTKAEPKYMIGSNTHSKGG